MAIFNFKNKSSYVVSYSEVALNNRVSKYLRLFRSMTFLWRRKLIHRFLAIDKRYCFELILSGSDLYFQKTNKNILG